MLQVVDANGGLTFDNENPENNLAGGDGDAEIVDDDEEPDEIVIINQTYYYLGHVIRLLAATHTLIAMVLVAAYYHLKVSAFAVVSLYRSGRTSISIIAARPINM